MIRVAVVAQDGLIDDAVAAVLAEHSDIGVVGLARTVEDGLAPCERADVLVVSRDLPEDGAMEIARRASARGGRARVLVEGLPAVNGLVLEYLEAGAAGYLTRRRTTWWSGPGRWGAELRSFPPASPAASWIACTSFSGCLPVTPSISTASGD